MPDLHVGSYGAFIWPAYAITLLTVVAMVADTLLRARRWKALAEKRKKKEPEGS